MDLALTVAKEANAGARLQYTYTKQTYNKQQKYFDDATGKLKTVQGYEESIKDFIRAAKKDKRFTKTDIDRLYEILTEARTQTAAVQIVYDEFLEIYKALNFDEMPAKRDNVNAAAKDAEVNFSLATVLTEARL
jgi:hypothetical protein